MKRVIKLIVFKCLLSLLIPHSKGVKKNTPPMVFFFLGMGFFFLCSPLLCQVHGNQDASSKDPAAEKAEDSKHPPKEEPTKTLTLPTLIVPVFEEKKICGYISLVFRFEFKDPKDSLKVKKLLPKILDALFTHFYKFFSILNYKKQTIDADGVRNRGKSVCFKLLDGEVFQDIYLDSYNIHQVNREQFALAKSGLRGKV